MVKTTAPEGRAARYAPLAHGDLPVDTVALARFLIGKVVVRETREGLMSGRIVETEAYPIGDPAGHAYRGRTPRNGTVFEAPGRAYVYQAYGISWMLNVSSEATGVGAGVLIRALEPLEGVGLMRERRGAVPFRDLARGPGRLAAALAIDRSLDGLDLCRRGALWIGRDNEPERLIGVSTRIGLTKAAEAPLRYYVPGSPFVSGPKALRS